MKNARSKLEVPMPAEMPSRTGREEYRETCSVLNNCETIYACIVEGDESTRKRMAETVHEGPEDHIAGKGVYFDDTLQFGAQVSSCAPNNENS